MLHGRRLRARRRHHALATTGVDWPAPAR